MSVSEAKHIRSEKERASQIWQELRIIWMNITSSEGFWDSLYVAKYKQKDEKAHYAARDPITALKKYMVEHNLATELELKSIEKKIDEVIEDAVEFADASPVPPRSQLLENVFVDPKGFGIGPDGKYRCEDPGFTQGTAQV